ncbi:CPBP family intramembrane metalloprotease [Pseudomonas sp. MAFF212428]|uniref:CPBP family intramembrane metalloprotease n=1 Tax=Pseudomonas brassicae TaxID=2708063 RepID=A0A6B3NRV0_9PSED|nr:CPBP family intramembrane metalloprotease [Pseudomonas brassicae]NER64849.1 CPBP family intramembrane metalloprotease [Pseudomonas brassicae]
MNRSVHGSPATSPYIATTTARRIALALLAVLLYGVAQIVGAFVFGKDMDFILALFGAHLVACAVIGGLYLWLRRNGPAGHAFKGANFSGKALWLGLSSVVVVYLLAYNYAALVAQPPEPFMLQFMSMLDSGSLVDRLLLVGMVIILAPVGEELAFRHFLFNLFPFKQPLWALLAIVVTALAFASIHLQYTFKSTVVLLFVLALMLAYARLKTGGLLVPMAMHACASTLALVLYPLFYP